MTTASLYRLSGMALVIGAILAAVSSLVSGVLFPDSSSPATATNPLNVLLSLIGVVGAVLALLGLPGMYARAARDGGLVWLVGVVLIAITAMLYGIFLGLLSVLVFPALASRAPDLFGQGPPPSFLAVFIIAALANVFGAILMGIPMITKQIYPRWCGYMMMVEAVLAAASFFVNGPGPSSLIAQILNVVAALPLFLVLGWAGYELTSGKLAATEVASGSAVAQPAGA
jgi:hypothetical protein